MDFWAVGGAERFWQRLSKKMPEYNWIFSTEVDLNSDLVVYSNNHRFYESAKKANKKIVMRLTGPRSYGLQQPDDLSALICSSKLGFDRSKHLKKHLIYNGIDFDFLKTIKPIKCDLLFPCARVGVGQRPETAIKYALKNNRQLTITGSGQHLAENTYDVLKNKYKMVNFTGLLGEEIVLGYIKGCNDVIMPTPTHGVSNAIIEARAFDKNIINIGNVEVPKKSDIDINVTAKKYKDVFENIFN